jgi:hypothetical protein
MEYRSRGRFEATIRVTLIALLWVGIIGIAWNMFKPRGWLFQFIGTIVDNRPTSYCYLAVGILGLLAAKYWLDELNPNAVANLLSFGCVFAGSYFILRLLLPL